MSQDFRIQQTSLVAGPDVTLRAVREGQMDGPQECASIVNLAVAGCCHNVL